MMKIAEICKYTLGQFFRPKNSQYFDQLAPLLGDTQERVKVLFNCGQVGLYMSVQFTKMNYVNAKNVVVDELGFPTGRHPWT
jgi:hypothetical protein